MTAAPAPAAPTPPAPAPPAEPVDAAPRVLGSLGADRLAVDLAPLRDRGWFFLHRRASPPHGRIDTIAVGPGGVVVLIAKQWSSRITITDRLSVSGWNQTEAFDTVLGQAAAVRQVVGAHVDVSSGLVLTEHPDIAAQMVRGVVVVGLGLVVEELDAMAPRHDEAERRLVLSALAEAFPPAA